RGLRHGPARETRGRRVPTGGGSVTAGMTAQPAPTVSERELIYVGDPMCSWCWGIAPELERFRARHELPLRVVVGGLRPGPAAEPLDERLGRFLSKEWRHIEEVTGQPFDHSTLERTGWLYDTEPAGRAVVTMRTLDEQAALSFFERVQRAFYAEAVDVTDLDAYPALLPGFGVDPAAFMDLLRSEESRRAAWRDFSLARSWGIGGFPTVLVREGEQGFILTRGYATADRLDEALAAAVV
ncbi:MAG: DsbA family protein, partial [Acidimicrobiia bacterium]